MSNQYGTEPIFRAAIINEFAQDRDSPRRQHNPYHNTATVEPEHSVEDVASVLGLPVDQVGPEVLDAFSRLLAEIERLRFEKEQAERRVETLQHLADRHSVVPCTNRRGFIRQLDNYLLTEGGGVVAMLHFGGIEALRMVHGQVAGEGALRHVCATIVKTLRSTDVVGCVGGSDFALLLPGCTAIDARVRLAQICAGVNEPPFQWMQQPQPLNISTGCHIIAKGEEGERALAAADRDRCAGGLVLG